MHLASQVHIYECSRPTNITNQTNNTPTIIIIPNRLTKLLASRVIASTLLNV